MKLLITITLLLSGQILLAQGSTLYVIGNEKGCPSEMNQTELISIFKGEKQRWRSGNKISLSMMKVNTSTGKVICQRVYNMSADEVNKFWIQHTFQGNGETPVFYNTSQDVQAYVAENPGAIGIIDNPPQSPGIFVIAIDGKTSL
jgi:hypothetical protein